MKRAVCSIMLCGFLNRGIETDLNMKMDGTNNRAILEENQFKTSDWEQRCRSRKKNLNNQPELR